MPPPPSWRDHAPIIGGISAAITLIVSALFWLFVFGQGTQRINDELIEHGTRLDRVEKTQTQQGDQLNRIDVATSQTANDVAWIKRELKGR